MPRKTPGLRPSIRGGFAGGTVGYNWQAGNLVLGVEADAAWADVGPWVGTWWHRRCRDSRLVDSGTVRGRVGYAFDQVLVYGTGGYAWADNRITLSALNVSIAESQIHSGWAAGAGVEVMFAPKWSVKAEYLYRSFASKNYFAGIAPPGIASGNLRNSIQVGVNYHF